MGNREPNPALRALLEETGWSPRRLAEEVNRLGTERRTPTTYTRQAVVHWLNGHVPAKETRPLIREALARKLGRTVSYTDLGLPPSQDEPNECADILVELVALAGSDMDPQRRILNAGLFAATLTIPQWEEIAGRALAVQTDRARRIGLPDVESVIDATNRVSVMDDERGGRYARPLAASLLVNMVAPYLRANAPESVRKEMLSAAADLCYLTGWMAVDEGLHGLAQRYYVKALQLSGAAEDKLTYSTILRGMSVQAVDLGHGPLAMQLADTAAASSPDMSHRKRAFLAGQQAHAAAQNGDRRAAFARLKEAEKAIEKAESPNRLTGGYDRPALAYHQSQVLFALGDVRGSVRSLSESQRLRPDSQRRTRIRLNGTLAERKLRLGHLEEACVTWHRLLDEYPQIHSGRCDDRISEMLRSIAPHLKRNHTARALWERAQAEVPPRLLPPRK
ncbi:tetratricopeptide repeat protein [Streptomyces sp. B1866]|uniref:tetratricopeptide repeat protein n=1 Tax=Streptomyces sp. B1866 TaxID=3075431 RepID=UPI00288D3BA2|nr:tetratricopeptide repeat protein [Streptomyces sp. B1866]MDT3399236.1 tetratricopeptide repeat protein [Streptomyces sp. B1866]